METGEAAQRWARTWRQAWPRQDVEAILRLYGEDAEYRSLAFRDAYRGRAGVRRYLRATFGAERDVRCSFGGPLVAGTRATVEWWASWVEDGEDITLAGATVSTFDGDGLVIDHRDYWNQEPGRMDPYQGW